MLGGLERESVRLSGDLQQRFQITFEIKEIHLFGAFRPILGLATAVEQTSQHGLLLHLPFGQLAEVQTGFKQAHTALLAIDVVDKRLHQAWPQAGAHHRQIGTEWVAQGNGCLIRIKLGSNVVADKTVSNHFTIATTHHHLTQLSQTDVAFTVGRQRSVHHHRARGQSVVAINAGQLFEEIFFNGNIEAIARCTHLPLALTFGSNAQA